MEDRPVIALTLHIAQTYKNISGSSTKIQNYRPSAANATRLQTDSKGYLIVRINDCFNNLYYAERPLGQGSFGRVVLARIGPSATHQARRVAIKIMKAGRLFRNKALEEVSLLKALSAVDPPITCQYIEDFVHGDHFCIVMEAMGSNLYHLLKSTNMQGFPLQTIRVWAFRYFTALRRLQQEDLRIVHTDCKPENTLVPYTDVSPEDIRLVDFGSAFRHPGGKALSYVQSRYYRSPEVLFRRPYDFQIDVWSVGVILFEMHTGRVLFHASSSDMLCYMMVDVLGYPPREMVMDAEKGQVHGEVRNYFRACGRPGGEDAGRDAGSQKADRSTESALDADLAELRALNERAFPHHAVPDAYLLTRRVIELAEAQQNRLFRKPLRELLRNPLMMGLAGHTDADYLNFEEFLSNILVYDPKKRWTVEEALNSRFIKGG